MTKNVFKNLMSSVANLIRIQQSNILLFHKSIQWLGFCFIVSRRTLVATFTIILKLHLWTSSKMLNGVVKFVKGSPSLTSESSCFHHSVLLISFIKVHHEPFIACIPIMIMYNLTTLSICIWFKSLKFWTKKNHFSSLLFNFLICCIVHIKPWGLCKLWSCQRRLCFCSLWNGGGWVTFCVCIWYILLG